MCVRTRFAHRPDNESPIDSAWLYALERADRDAGRPAPGRGYSWRVPGLEVIIFSFGAVAVMALLVILRRERLARESGDPPTMHPFVLGLYRGCAFVAFLFAMYVIVTLIATIAFGPPTRM